MSLVEGNELRPYIRAGRDPQCKSARVAHVRAAVMKMSLRIQLNLARRPRTLTSRRYATSRAPQSHQAQWLTDLSPTIKMKKKTISPCGRTYQSIPLAEMVLMYKIIKPSFWRVLRKNTRSTNLRTIPRRILRPRTLAYSITLIRPSAPRSKARTTLTVPFLVRPAPSATGGALGPTLEALLSKRTG